MSLTVNILQTIGLASLLIMILFGLAYGEGDASYPDWIDLLAGILVLVILTVLFALGFIGIWTGVWS